ncbi:Pyridoxal-dependent decarboxylase [Sulfidibacter corallicola]|uniref:Glutamate or tyrosine decarboxylase n=1 Tax=Sulfidibacter corallicola TaxID=2818388 RepID=A0A8A4THC5_SULCO|nr:pyridoxal-dependent decarboxylase [Sulfidibacter corallicola]QTD48211.1 hypothetical protein J3U87_21710 [Sulfidibacter corallicola]
MPNSDLSFMHPYYMGAYAENDHVFEKILLEFLRDHAYWRRNFHPENRPPIPTNAPYREHFNEFLAQMQQELHTLSADLKKSVPFFSPRYMGHMAADLLLPGVLAQIMTILYNPNNVSDDAAPATLDKELEVGFQLARMFGYNIDDDREPNAWGHLTSGGTVANYEGVWNLRAVRCYPLALAEAAQALELTLPNVGPKRQPLGKYTKWELFNFSIRQTVLLMRECISHIKSNQNKKDFHTFTRKIMEESVAHLGMAGFFLKHPELKLPVLMVPVSAHYSWEKSMKILGLGSGNLVPVNTDGHMRMKMEHLEELLEDHYRRQIPVLGVVGVLGSTEFGSVDPINRIVEFRKKYFQKGFYFGVHVDAAWGGYMASLFRMPDGSFIPHDEIRSKFNYFPHEGTWLAFKAVAECDSVTVDPHKLGYLPFPCGAFVSRDSGVLDFISQKAAYVFDVKEDSTKLPVKKKLLSLGQYIMEGSKPGSAAAAAYVTHRCIPLHHDGFGQIMAQSMRACEYFFDKIQEVKKKLKGLVTITVPFPPDTNLICFAINPKNNTYLALMNHFSRKVFNNMKINPNQPLQAHDFFGSCTSLFKAGLETEEANRILSELGINPETFCEHVSDRTREADHIYVIRHTLMNPWLMYEDNGMNYIDRYCLFIERAIDKEMHRAIRRK